MQRVIINKVSAYLELSKAKIAVLLLFTVFTGYFSGLPLEKPFLLSHFISTFWGIFLLAAGSGALNQIQEQTVDAKMPRTKNRPLPSGRLSAREAWLFSISTMVIGLGILSQISAGVFYLGLIAYFSYNGLYTVWFKHKMAHGAVPGAIPGALPVWMAFAAASGSITDIGGIFLFFVLIFWQMPHFWALAIKYKEDYRSGGIPTLPVVLGDLKTLREVKIWGYCYLALMFLAPLFLKLGSVYAIGAPLVGFKVFLELKKFIKHPFEKIWLSYFLWINLSLVLFLSLITLDLWSVYLVPTLSNWRGL